MMNDKVVYSIIFMFGVFIGFVLGSLFAPVTTGKFYDELRKRSINSSEFICNEAKETKFLYEQFEKKGLK